MVVWKNKMSSPRGRGRAGKRVGRTKSAPKSTSTKNTTTRAAKRARGSARQSRGSRNTRGGIKPSAEPKVVTTTTTTSAKGHGEPDSDIVYANDEKVVESNKTVVGNNCEIHGENLIVIGSGHTIYARNVKVHGDANTIHSNSPEIHGVNNIVLGYASPAIRTDDNTYIDQTDNDSFFQHRVYPRDNRDLGSNLTAFNSNYGYSSRHITPPSIGSASYCDLSDLPSMSQLVHGHYLSMRVAEELVRGFGGSAVSDISETTTTTTTTTSNSSGAGNLPDFPIDLCSSDDEHCDDNEMGARECSVCMENKIKAVVLPCAHACMCLSCASKIISNAADSGEKGKCPICRKEIENIIKIYLK